MSSQKKALRNWKFHFKYADQVYSMTVPELYNEKKIYEKMLNDEYKIDVDEKAEIQNKRPKLYVKVFKATIPIVQEMNMKGRWTKVGKMSDIVKIQQCYSDLFFKLGTNFCGPIRDIIPYTYNKGVYFMFKHNYPLGDGQNPVHGNCIFSFGKDGDKDQKKVYRHDVMILNGVYNYRTADHRDFDLYVMPF